MPTLNTGASRQDTGKQNTSISRKKGGTQGQGGLWAVPRPASPPNRGEIKMDKEIAKILMFFTWGICIGIIIGVLI